MKKGIPYYFNNIMATKVCYSLTEVIFKINFIKDS